MTVREELEFQEHRRLNPLASFSDKSSGRPTAEEPRPDDVRTCYQRDIDRIVHSKAFRRLMHKTQVFLRPEGDHYRTRMTHTLEVSRIAGTITRALGLNEDLAEAIAMGHDLGHTPFGHAGEAALSRCLGKPFRHNEQSLRVVDVLENEGRGLNLTNEVRLGILGSAAATRLLMSTTILMMPSGQGSCETRIFPEAFRMLLAAPTGTGSIPWSVIPSVLPGRREPSA